MATDYLKELKERWTTDSEEAKNLERDYPDADGAIHGLVAMVEIAEFERDAAVKALTNLAKCHASVCESCKYREERLTPTGICKSCCHERRHLGVKSQWEWAGERPSKD